MTHDLVASAILNEKFRNDALHVFVSGLKKSLKWAVFPAQPIDLPSALALAQEAESSNERGIFAANFAKHLEEKPRKQNSQKSQNWRQNVRTGIPTSKRTKKTEMTIKTQIAQNSTLTTKKPRGEVASQ